MAEGIDLILERLLADPVLGKARYAALARLLPHARIERHTAGASLYAAEAEAAELRLIVSGEARLVAANGRTITRGPGLRVGEEAGTDFTAYLSAAEATTDLVCVVLPRKRLHEMLKDASELKTELYRSLLGTFAGDALGTSSAAKPARAEPVSEGLRTAGWLLVVLVPGLVLWAMRSQGLDLPACITAAACVTAVLMWVFRVVDEYIPALFVLLIALCAGVAPPLTVLGGFASDGFFMAMSILGLGTVIVASGLSYRVLLWAMLRLPRTPAGIQTVLMILGGFLTPVVPTANGRVGLVAPFANDAIGVLRLAPGGPGATRVAMAAFTGTTLLSGAFLTSKSVNFVVFGLMDQQLQDRFQFLMWFAASAVATVVLLAAYLLVQRLAVRGVERAEVPRELVVAQLRLLGGLKRREWAGIAGIAFFIVGILTYSLHAIPPPWLGLTILDGLLLCGFLTRKEFREQVDWTFLAYLAGVVGIVNVVEHVGLGAMLAGHLAPIGAWMRQDLATFFIMLAGLVFVMRLIVPIPATIVLLAVTFMPIAASAGVNQWVVGFAILMLGEMWFLPYQCSYYLQFQEMCLRRSAYDERRLLWCNAWMNVAKLVALVASLPYWRALGLIP